LLLAFAALLVAFLLVYFIFTGYVHTGYFLRYLPLTVYLNNLLLALGLVAMIDCVYGWYALSKQSISWQRMISGGGMAVAAFGLLGVIGYWGSLQTFLFRKLPPDTISFFPTLSTPPFRDSTFVALAYGGAVAYFTKNWAYFDFNSALAEGTVTLGPDGYHVKLDKTYAWFADRATNSAYNKPEYFMTMTYQSLGLGYLSNREVAPRPRVGDVPLIRAIREGHTSYLHPVEVAHDFSPLDRWSIVRLDWDFPPFLRPLEAGEFVALHVSSMGNGVRIHVDYRYAQQDSVPEANTRVALFAQPRCAGSEQTASVPVSPLAAGEHDFVLPLSFAGTVRAEVEPATATKVGPIYTSRVLDIGSPDSCPGPLSKPH
jgi:hypothetical protein